MNTEKISRHIKVANMFAIKEMDDYRNFANFSEDKTSTLKENELPVKSGQSALSKYFSRAYKMPSFEAYVKNHFVRA